jgi:hypothetical protein
MLDAFKTNGSSPPGTSSPAHVRPDVVVEYDGGTVVLVRPRTEAALRWLIDNVQSDAQWFGNALVVEARYVRGLVIGLSGEGFVVVGIGR